MTKESDKPYWVPVDIFLSRFSQEDFHCREVIEVSNMYYSCWFHESEGLNFFEIPTVYIINGKTEFVSGRHRTAVLLLNDLKVLPFGFAEGKAQEFAERLQLQSITAPFELPNLPVVYRER